jgi:hypothetical protein
MADFDLSGYSAAPASTDAQVFWGFSQAKGYEIDAGLPANKPTTIAATEAQGYLYQLAQSDPNQYAAYRNRMIAAGVIDKDASGFDMQQTWMRAIGASADAYAAGVNLTPWDAIDLLGGKPGEEDGPFTGTRTTKINSTSTDTRRQIKLSSAQEARAFLMAAAEKELGRAATADEIAQFRAGLNAEERANATTVKTTSREKGTATSTIVDGIETASDRNTTSSSSSTETGGMDRGQYSLDAARSANDWAEYQTATTYMQAMFAALDSTVNVG